MSIQQLTAENTFDLICSDMTIRDNLTVDGDFYIGGDFQMDTLTIANTTNSTNEITGAFIVSGGVGITKDLYVGGTITAENIVYTDIVANTDNSTSPTTGSLIIPGGAGIAKNLNVGANMTVWGTTNASSTSTGSFNVLGGAGISGNLYVGGNIIGTYTTTTTESTSINTGALLVNGGIGIAKNAHIGGQFYSEANINSSSYTTGSMVITGGLGVSNNINSNGNLTISGASNLFSASVSSTLNSTGINSGALKVLGGASISKDLHIGGNLFVDGILNEIKLNSTNWFLINTLSTSQNLNVVARTGSNNLTQLVINAGSYSTNLENFELGFMPRFIVYSSGGVINVFVSSPVADTNIKTLLNDVALTKIDYGNETYPTGYDGYYVFDTATNAGFSTSDKFYIYNSEEANSTETGALIVVGGISANGIYTGVNGITTSNGVGGSSSLYTDSSGNLQISSSNSGIIVTSSNTQLKVQRVDDLSVASISNAPIYDYGAISSLKKIGCVEGFFINPDIWGATTSSSANYGSVSVNSANGALELSSLSGGIIFRKPINHTFFLYGDQYQPNYTTGSISSGSMISLSGDLALSDGILLNAGGSTASILKYATGRYVDDGQFGGFSCYFKTNSNYSNPPSESVNIIQLYGNSANGSNQILLYHHTTGYLKLKCIDADGVLIMDSNLGLFDPVPNTPYFMSVDWDFTNGSTQVFLNGIRIGAPQLNFATRNYSTYLIISCPATASFTISFVQIFLLKQYSGAYTPPTKTNYNLASFPSTGGLQLYSDLSNTISGTLTCNYDNSLYWNGSPIVGTFSPANVLNLTNTTESTDATTGSLTVAGGVGISGNFYNKGTINCANTSNSTSTNTGSIVLLGGFGVAKQSHFGDQLTIHNLGSSGILTQINSDAYGYCNMNINTGFKVNSAINYIWYASLTTSLTSDYSYVSSSLIPTTSGSVSISSGMMLIGSASSIYWNTTGAGGCIDSGQNGCINFKYKPAYSGYPSATATLCSFVNSSGNANKLQLYQLSSGSLKLQICDNSGTTIFDTNFGAFTFTSGSTYEIEVNWSPSTSRLFINGTQYGATISTSITGRTGVCSRLYIASTTSGSSFSVGQLQVFNSTQHTANYTAFQTIAGNLLTANTTGLTVNGAITSDSTLVLNTANSSGTLSGCMVAFGGVGIAKSVNIGQNLSVGGTITGTVTNPWTVITNVGLGGGAIGNVPSISFALSICPNTAMIKCFYYTNNQGASSSNIYTASGVIPTQFLPARDQFIPVGIIANNNNVIGTIQLRTDGTIIWNHSFGGSETNGFSDICVLYSLS